MRVDLEKAAVEIIEVLHYNQIPIGLTEEVCNQVMKKIAAKTIPYNPKKETP